MEKEVWQKAGYYHDLNSYEQLLKDLVWDDNYILLSIGDQPIKGDEYYSGYKWINVPTNHGPIEQHLCLFRRLKPGLTVVSKDKIKEE